MAPGQCVTGEALDLAALLAGCADPASGALVVFGGTVRNHHDGRAVERLAYSAYAPLAERLIREIEAETVAKFGVHHCRVLHRTGDLAVGAVAIYAVVRAAHRREAFAAAQYAVDRVKHEAPIWKEEFYADGTSAFVQGCCLAAPEKSRSDLFFPAVLPGDASSQGSPRRFAPRDDTQEHA